MMIKNMSVNEDNLFTVYVGKEEADPSEDRIFREYLCIFEIMYNRSHEYDCEVAEFFDTITFH